MCEVNISTQPEISKVMRSLLESAVFCSLSVMKSGLLQKGGGVPHDLLNHVIMSKCPQVTSVNHPCLERFWVVHFNLALHTASGLSHRSQNDQSGT